MNAEVTVNRHSGHGPQACLRESTGQDVLAGWWGRFPHADGYQRCEAKETYHWKQLRRGHGSRQAVRRAGCIADLGEIHRVVCLSLTTNHVKVSLFFLASLVRFNVKQHFLYAGPSLLLIPGWVL